MNEAVFNLLMAVVTAAVTALSAFVAAFVKKKGEQVAAAVLAATDVAFAQSSEK